MKHPFDLLQSNLLDLLYELRTSDIHLTVVGGYGLYLKRQSLYKAGARPLLPLITEPRSTDDLDLFLATQILADPKTAKSVLTAVRKLQFESVANKENFQFEKMFQIEAQKYRVKLDFLTRIPDDSNILDALDIQDVRVRNKKGGGIHAHRTDEAIAIEDDPIPIVLTGLRTTGEEFSGQVYLPQAYTYLMMKLFAFRDWEIKKRNSGHASKHALDLYSIVAMLTEKEFMEAQQASQTYRHRPATREAAGIVQEFFLQVTTMGNIRLREHPRFSRDMDLAEFISVLGELFPK